MRSCRPPLFRKRKFEPIVITTCVRWYCRFSLSLRDLEELNQEETASALGISITLVKVRLHRARMMLQKLLAPYLKSAAPAKKGFFGRMFQ